MLDQLGALAGDAVHAPAAERPERGVEGALARIGSVRYLGEDPGLAQLTYQANLDIFPDLPLLAAPRRGAAGDGWHPGHLSTITMMGATADHLVEASEAAGIDVDLPRAVQAHYTWARSRGHGGENWSRIIDAIRPYV